MELAQVQRVARLAVAHHHAVVGRAETDPFPPSGSGVSSDGRGTGWTPPTHQRWERTAPHPWGANELWLHDIAAQAAAYCPRRLGATRFRGGHPGQVGRIEKTITLHTNEPDSPHVVTVVFHALPSGMAGADTQAVFQPPCASCHLDPGIGQHSAALFAAVCAMCHPDGVKIREPDALAHWITEGNPHTGMPGFQDRLTGAQVQSLVTLLKQ